MDVEINYGNIEKDDKIAEHVWGELEQHLGRHLERLTRIEVHLNDQNGPKGGERDKRCMIEQRPRGSKPIAVEATGGDMYTVITAAAGKAQRALESWIGKKEAGHHGQGGISEASM
jgi:ribosome-associated translation inhibitor RaiA